MKEKHIKFIEDILENSIKESENLEFKNYEFMDSKFNKLETRQKDQLFKEVCAFANTDGGKIVIGIAEDDNHNPSSINDTLVQADKFEEWEQSFRNIIATKTIPAIYGIKLEHVEVDGKNCIIIDIPKSYLKPHAYDDGEHKFYMRNGNESRPMRYPELKNSFLALDNIQQKLLMFRNSRISNILDGEIHDDLQSSPLLLLHIIPETSLSESTYIDLRSYEFNNKIDTFNRTMYSNYNANGLIKTRIRNNSLASYIQLFSNGILEVGESFLLRAYENEGPFGGMKDSKLIYPWPKLEKIMAEKIYTYCIELSKNVGQGFYICFSLLNVKDRYSTDYDFVRETEPLRQNIIRSQIVKWSVSEPYPQKMYYLFTNFANIFGSRESWLYDENDTPIDGNFDFIEI